MKTLNVDWMYFTGIRDGNITALFFDAEVMHGLKKGDVFQIYYDRKRTFKMYFDYSKIISFRDVDDNLAKKAGFLSKELLEDHLIKKYHISTFGVGIKGHIENELFFVITFADDPSKVLYDDGESKKKIEFVDTIKSITLDSKNSSPKVELYENSPYYINEMYNPEYDSRFWTEEMKR